MNLKFNWYVSKAFKDNIPRPTAEMIDPLVGSKGTLACLLMDDGGSGHQNALPWIEKALERSAAVKSQEIGEYEWSRETWAARISIKGVHIYSLHDESYSDFVSLDFFERALRAWKSFIQSPPDFSRSVEVLCR